MSTQNSTSQESVPLTAKTPTTLEELIKTINKSELTFIAGIKGMGKTELAISILNSVSLRIRPIASAYFSLDETKENIKARLSAYMTFISLSKIMQNDLKEHEISVITQANRDIDALPIYIDDSAEITFEQVKDKIRQLVKMERTELVIIDYLQLIKLDSPNNNIKHTEITKGLNELAKELDIAIVLICAIGRRREISSPVNTSLPNLFDYTEISEYADQIFYCYRPDFDKLESFTLNGKEYDSKGLFIVKVSRIDSDNLVEIPLKFDPEKSRITNRCSSDN